MIPYGQFSNVLNEKKQKKVLNREGLTCIIEQKMYLFIYKMVNSE